MKDTLWCALYSAPVHVPFLGGRLCCCLMWSVIMLCYGIDVTACM
jgi:hypothetical protein